MSDRDIDPNKAVDFIIEHSRKFAQAKAHRIYMEEYRKSLKAILMKESIESAVNAQERDAYAHPDMLKHLEALREAVQEEEALRWQMVAAEARVEVWRSQEATKRSEVRVVL